MGPPLASFDRALFGARGALAREFRLSPKPVPSVGSHRQIRPGNRRFPAAIATGRRSASVDHLLFREVLRRWNDDPICRSFPDIDARTSAGGADMEVLSCI